MPFGDRTGPLGLGPMTGRAAGYCAGYPVPGYLNPIPGRGFGRGAGFGGGGRGRRNMYYATGLPGWARAGWGPAAGYPAYWAPDAQPAPQISAEQELEALKAQAEQFQGTLENINKRIGELESSRKEK